MPYTILYLDGSGEISGAEVSLLTLVTNLDRRRYQPVVALPWEGSFCARLADEGVPVVTLDIQSLALAGLNPLTIARDALRTLPFILALTRFVRANDVALIHVNSYRIGIPCSLAARLAGVPVVWHVRDIATSTLKRRAVSLMARLLADRVIAISRAVAAQLDLDPARVATIYNAIDARPFARAHGGPQVRQDLGIGPETLLIGNVGQFVPWKGQDLLIRALARVTALVDDVRLLLVGYHVPAVWDVSAKNREYEARLRRLVGDLGLDEEVTFVGFRDDIASVMDALDVYVHASVRPEPFGRVLVEAMASRTPVIAPSHGGVPEIVEHGRTGLLFQPRDERALADAILTLACDKPGRQAMGRRGALVARQKFPVEKHVRQVETLYGKLLPGQR